MGKRHFKQMMADAFELDQKAMVEAWHLVSLPIRLDQRLFGRDFWDGATPDVIMEAGRKLVPLSEQFADRLKGLLVEGIFTVHVHDQYGRLHKLRDPDVIDYDWPRLNKKSFIHTMMDDCMSGELCSGDQNANANSPGDG